MDIFLASVLAIIATFTYISLLVLHHNSKPRKPANLPPGNMGWPLIGEAKDFSSSGQMGRPEKFMMDRMRRYSPEVFKTSLLGEKMAVFCGSTGHKFVFSNENIFVKSWFPRSVMKILLPNHRESDIPDVSHRMRTIYSEFLKLDAIQKYIQVMDSVVKRHLDQEWAPCRTVKVKPLAKKLMFTIACELFMGVKDISQIEMFAILFETVVAGIFSIPIDLPGTRLRRGIEAANYMRNDIMQIVRQEKFRMSGNKESRRWNLLSHLVWISDEEKLSDFDIASTILAVLIGSQHTTSSLIMNIVYFLADYPDICDKASTEQMEIIKLKGGEEVLLNWEDMKKMKYSRNVMNEVLRLAPPAFGFFRQAIRDINFAGYTIPQGWKIFWSFNSTHKNPQYFQDPYKFDPSRFEGNGPAPFTFVPFGGGPNMCPGSEFARQSTLVFMHNLLVKFKWERLSPTEKIIFDSAVVGPEHGLPIRLRPCQHQQEIGGS